MFFMVVPYQNEGCVDMRTWRVMTMYAKLLFCSVLTAISAHASPIDCANELSGNTIDVSIEQNHEKGTLSIDGRTLNRDCEKDSTGRQLSCKAFLANSVYEVKINRTQTRTIIWQYKGHVVRTIGGIAGNISQDYGHLICSEWSDGALPR
jgi:hypothetical protein